MYGKINALIIETLKFNCFRGFAHQRYLKPVRLNMMREGHFTQRP